MNSLRSRCSNVIGYIASDVIHADIGPTLSVPSQATVVESVDTPVPSHKRSSTKHSMVQIVLQQDVWLMHVLKMYVSVG